MQTWIVRATKGDQPGIAFTSVVPSEGHVDRDQLGEPAKMARLCEEHGWEYTFVVAVDAADQREAAIDGMGVIVDAFPDDFENAAEEAEVVGEFVIPPDGYQA